MNNRGKDWHILRALRAEALERPEISSATPAWREVMVFSHTLDAMPIFHCSGERLAGDFGWRPEDDQLLAERFPPAPPAPPVPRPVCDTLEARLYNDFHCFGSYSAAHTCMDYAKLLNLGLDGVLDGLRKAGDGECRQAMAAAVQSLQHLIARYAALLEKVGESGLAQLCTRIRHQRPRTFAEAVQLIWFAHLAIGISESSDASISLGRFDQYALPCYRQSLADGVEESALELQFAALVDKLNRYGDAACALNLGGLDAEGRDQCNDLSRLIVRICKAKLLPAPILAARIHADIPQDIFDALVDPALFAIGQPTFYGEQSCLAAMRERGVAEDAVVRWAANSCMGLVVEGCEVSNMWGGVVNFLLPIELALNGGKPFRRELPFALKTRPDERPGTFASLQASFLAYLGEITDFCVAASRTCTDRVRRERPNPYLSAFLGHCTERGRDRLDGGADYHVAIIEAFGLANAADALYAVRSLCFERPRYRLDELVAAAKADFVGHEGLLQEIRALPKYGNGDTRIDMLAAELADAFQRLVRRHSDTATCFAPSFHTLNAHVGAGAKVGASLDGRRAGEPLAKNIGAGPGTATTGLTALIRSAAAIDQTAFFGGQALDISVDARLISRPDGQHKFHALIQTYFSLGGLQIQVNGLSAETLVEAIDHPDAHRDLIVRIGGYSDYFNNLSLDVRKEMVERIAKGQ